MVLSMFYNILNKPNYEEISNITNLSSKIDKNTPGAVLIIVTINIYFMTSIPQNKNLKQGIKL